jgi:DNA-binding response OmpR family regulator
MEASNRKNGTVLLVEDDPDVGDGFARLLRAEGYDVWWTPTADEGLEQCRLVRPDAIIVDFRMPLVNGLGFLYRLRASEKGQPAAVLVVTGDITLDDEVKEELRELGAGLRFKPIPPEELIDAVDRMIAPPPAQS